ncbi:MAG: hypothetical protein FE78DRAFT_84631 [Acidomyces sp. 'richmondensis']|nr:MAG: hypothetical protein FE78DRAFT_84631 [Acidomyces sp. 'richmondensis']
MSTAGLSPPGTSTYSSNTLHVGDGTWDSSRDDFLLPPLVGLNFATMRYNGMGNRFRGLTEYHQLILGHGVLAAITFLFILPLAIWSAKYWRTGGRRAVKLHVYLQILVITLSTVILVLGWFAVGPERSLTNPHHDIGVAIYAALWFQFLYGWMMGRMEKRRQVMPTRVPTKVWLHKLLGRAIALLAIIQIALGLTLYGSPKVLFILYSLWVAVLLFGYLALDRFYFEKRPVEFGYDNAADFYSDYGSYISGSRTDYTQHGPPPRRPQDRRNLREKLLEEGGVLGAYEWFKHRRSKKRGEREQAEIDAERRRSRPPSNMAPSGSRPSSRPPPGVEYRAGAIAGEMGSRRGSRPPPGPGHLPPPEESRLSSQSWDSGKYSERPQHTWRDRLLGVGAGIAAFEGVRSLFNRRKRRENEYYDSESNYRPHEAASQNMVNQTDVSRVEQGEAPMSPNGPESQNLAGVQPMTPTQTPSRPMRRPRPDADDLSYDDDRSAISPEPGRTRPSFHHDGNDENHTLRDSIAALGAIAGFREWSRRRKERRERQRAEKIRRQELDSDDVYGRPSFHGPTDRPSISGTGTVMTGATQDNLDHSQSRIDTSNPPLPATAGTIPSMSGVGAPLSTVGPSVSQQRLNQHAGEYHLPPPPPPIPPPPPGPPPGGARPLDYRPPEPGSLQMPEGAVTPDPSRLVSQENVTHDSSGHPIRDGAIGATAGALFGAAAADLRSGRRRDSQSDSPSRYHGPQDSRNRLQKAPPGSMTSASIDPRNTDVPPPAEAGPSSPPVSVRVKMHRDGDHMTFQRLTEEEAEAKRAARRAERRGRRRRGSSQSSILEDEAPPGSNQRYRRNGGPIRRSSDQPITNVPPLPPMSASGSGRRQSSELDQPPAPPGAQGPPPPVHATSPQSGVLNPPPAPIIGSGLSGSPGDAGTGTDVSAFADNRRRRRAERARRLEAARGAGRQVEFQ